MNIAVLFDGVGLARYGLECAGHKCIGFELDKEMIFLGEFVGFGMTVHADVLDVFKSNTLQFFDAVWASPPCQKRSSAKNPGTRSSAYSADLLSECMSISHDILWVENVVDWFHPENNTWGQFYNAGQFTRIPFQSRPRIVGGNYRPSRIFRPYSRRYVECCPTVTATEYKGSASDKRRASRFYGRKLTLSEVAFYQGLKIPPEWREISNNFTDAYWVRKMYTAIGNGVLVYMSCAFGKVYRQ